MKTAALALLLIGLFEQAEARCRLALALAVDVSSSVDAQEDALQRGGIAFALQAPEVRDAFFSSPQPVALAVYEWSGRYNQELLVDWRLIETPQDLSAVAQAVANSKRSHNDFPTAMGYALGYGAQLLVRAPDCAAKKIDVAGDGQNNEGFGPEEAYAAFPFDNVTVNGLVVVDPTQPVAKDGLVSFFKSEVLRGPGAFVEIADGFEDYARAMRRKLEREVTPPVVSQLGLPKRPPI